MGDADFGGDDYFFEDDWLYIEDDVAFADELAESQIPSPGYAGTNAELMYEWFEYDTYEYFSDLEYGSDDYWDITLAAMRQTAAVAEDGQRKRKRTSATTHTEKRRKVRAQDETFHGMAEWQTVVYRQDKPAIRSAPATMDSTASFALFPDWRERFPVDADVPWHKAMPDDMKRAAQAEGAVLYEDKGHEDALQDPKSPVIDERPLRHNKKRKAARLDLDEANEDESPHQDLLSSLDPEALRAALRSKLGDAGLDEEAFMSVLSNMLAGGESADGALAQLADTLLDQQDDNADARLNWLEDHGVKMDQADEELEPVERRVDSGAGSANTLAKPTPDSSDSHAQAQPAIQRPSRSKRARTKK